MAAKNAISRRLDAVRVDKDSTTPAYLQIAERVTALLKSSILPAGFVLPPERVLCEQFGVSRMTLRQAMSLVEREGLIESHRGRGTFVSSNRLRKQQQELRSFNEEIRARGGKPETKMISFELVKASNSIGEFFDLNDEQKTYEIVRLRLKDGEPLAIEMARIPELLCPGLKRFDLAKHSLYQVLEESYGVILDHSVEEISAELSTPDHRKLLQLPKGAAVLVVNRKAFTEEGRAAELTRSVYRGDLYSAVVRSTRKRKIG